MSDTLDSVRRFYDAYGRDEWDRLTESLDGRIEFEETVARLEASLPESGHVLDAGGGAGRYAIWLAERGYEVTLLDLSRRQTILARDHAAERGLDDQIRVVQGSITDLPLSTDAVDAVCCLGGPVSHLLAESDRRRAVEELERVGRPGTPVFVSVMGLLGMVQLQVLAGGQVELLPDLLEHGDYDESLVAEYGYEQPFTATHFFRREELRDLLAGADLQVRDVVGLEGVASPLHDAALRERRSEESDRERDALRRVIRATNDEQAVADLSVHMLAIATVPNATSN